MLVLLWWIMSRTSMTNFVRIVTKTSPIRFFSEIYKPNYRKRRQTRDFDKRSWSKKDTGPSIPLPDIRGETLWGIHSVQAALCAEKRDVYMAFFKTGVMNSRVNVIRTLCQVRNVSMYEMSGSTLDALVGNHPHQGICLDVSTLPIDTLRVDDITSDSLMKPNGEPVVWMLPYKVKDTMNMGAILRSSHYFGVDRVLVPASYSSAMNSVVSKASAGAMEIMDIKSLKDRHLLEQCLMKWKSIGGIVVGSTSDAHHVKTVPISQFLRDKPVLLITGSESEGLGDYITNFCDILLSIPTYQTVNDGEWLYQLDSLNVSVATGVLLHSVITNRKNNN